MNNEGKKQDDLSECIKQSFDIVAEVYDESSFLLNDLAVKLEKLGFEKLNERTITKDLSKHINYPRYWLTRYAALFFTAKAEPNSKRLLSTTISYFDVELKASKPFIIVGVGEKSGNGNWEYWWMHEAFFNGSDMFRYYGRDNEVLSIRSPQQDWPGKEDEWGFKVPDDRATSYPKAGKLFAVPLIEINNSEDVKKLADRGAKLWDTKLTWDTDDQ